MYAFFVLLLGSVALLVGLFSLLEIVVSNFLGLFVLLTFLWRSSFLRFGASEYVVKERRYGFVYVL